MKRLKLFFACMLMAVFGVGNVWGADVETSFSWAGSATATSGTTDYVVTESPITLTFAQGTNTNNAPRTNKEGAVRMYVGTTLTISSTAGNITRVVFTPTTNSYQATNLSYNSTALTGNDWTLGTPAASVELIATANARFKAIVVYTAEGGGSSTVSVTGVTLDEEAISLAEGETQTLTATVAPGNATNKAVTWSSDDESVATVDGGVVTAVAAGTATITVTTTDGSFTDECEVTVTEAPAASNWQVIAPENLATGDVVVLTMNVGGTYYAAANNNGTSSAPAATSVAVTGSSLSATPATTLQWTVTVVSDGVFQFAAGDDKLYCTETNNGVRVGPDPNTTFCNTFDIAIENNKSYLHATTLTRYLGIYNSQDWRCYGSVNNNIKGGTLVIFKENDNRKANGLDFATKQYLIKKNASFSAPTLSNEHDLTVSYLSSNTDVAEVNASTGAITIKADATGAATITAAFAGDETYKDGSASYTIFVAEKAGTNEEGEILTEAIAKELIDLGCTLDVYVTGTILTPQYYNQSKTYTVTLTDGFQFYYFFAGPNETTFDEDILTAGDVLVAYGSLKKSGNNYRLNPCYMVSREPYSEPKVDISNTAETAYTPAQAIAKYNDVTSDLTRVVYVKGVVVASPAIKYNTDLTDAAVVYNGTYNVYVKAEDDDSENPTKIEFFRMYADDNNTTFADGDIQVGEIIIAKGLLSKYSNTYELAAGCQMVSKKSKATMTFDDLELVVGNEETLAPKTITLAPASAVSYSIKEGSDECVTLDGSNITATAEGTATIVATLVTTDDYIGTSVEFTVTVSAAPVVLTDYYEKVTSGDVVEGTYLIVYETDGLAFNGGLETLDAENNTIAVDITSDNKIGVTSATEAATFYIDPVEGTIKSASEHYIGVSSWSNGLKQATTYVHNVLEIDVDGKAQVGIYNAEWNNTGGTMLLQYNKSQGQERFRYYKNGGQQSIALYKLANEAIKQTAGLAWSPADDITLTVGDALTAPTLLNPNNIADSEITIASSNTNVATINNGEVELVAEATGTTTITATFAGNDNYKAAEVSYKITVNPAHSIYVSPGLNVNFGSVLEGASVDNQIITVTLTGVDAATLTLSGTGASAFSISPTDALVESGDIIISATAETVGEFSATLTISDDANLAASKKVKLSLTVVDPSTVETAISTTSQWMAATAIEDGMQVLITGVKEEVTYAMGEQKSTNRAAYAGTLAEGIFTPGAGTMAFTLVAQGDGTYAIRTSNGKYLYAAKEDGNHLKTQDEVDVNAKWTLTVISAVAESSSNRNVMQFNGSGENKLFSCYASTSQIGIQLYVPYVAPEPVLDPIAAIGGKFIINQYGDTAVFSRGNLQYQQSTNTWRCAPKQYNWQGMDNLQMGNADYEGWVDLFCWSLGAENNYGATSAYLSTAYQNKDFVDWGGLFAGEWSTLSSAELKYLLNTRSGANDKWGMAMIGENLGMILLPDEWSDPSGVTFVPRTVPTSELWDESDYLEPGNQDHCRVNPANMPANKFTPAEWAELEAAGAVFLPYAGRRSGGYGNHINRDDVEQAAEYNFTYYENYLGAYWTSTLHNAELGQADYFYSFKYTKSGNEESYDWGKGVVWSENGRYGQSVRLAHIIPRQYTVTYDANGAEGNVPTDENTYIAGALITVAGQGTLAKEGYRFVGWKLGESTYNENEQAETPKSVNDVVFEAQWELDYTTIRAELYDGKWGTICPKQKILQPIGASFYKLTYMDENGDGTPYRLFFDEIAEGADLEAGKPYLFIAEGAEIKGVKVGAGAGAEDGHHEYNGFCGYLGAAAWEVPASSTYDPDGTNYYGLTNNTFTLLGEGCLVPNERAYVKVTATQPTRTPSAPVYGRRRVVAGNNAPSVATGMDALNASEQPMKMMIDGQLFIIRGEKMFDATGRLVK